MELSGLEDTDYCISDRFVVAFLFSNVNDLHNSSLMIKERCLLSKNQTESLNLCRFKN